MTDFPIKYKYPAYPNTLVPDEKVQMGERSKGRRLEMDYTIYNTYADPVLRDKLFKVSEERHPSEYFLKSLVVFEKYLFKPKKIHKSKRINKEAQEPFAVAIEQAKKEGHGDFSEGSPGRERRGEIAEAVKEDKHVTSTLHNHRVDSTSLKPGGSTTGPLRATRPTQAAKPIQPIKSKSVEKAGSPSVLGETVASTGSSLKSPIQNTVEKDYDVASPKTAVSPSGQKIQYAVEKAAKKDERHRIWCPKHHRWESDKWARHDYKALLKGLSSIVEEIDQHLGEEND